MHQTLNKIKFINIDIDKYNHNKYDLIVSNPPYINNISLKRLEDNVRLYEPHVALKAGYSGLSEIKKLILKSKTLLKKNGNLIFEIGNKQHFDVMKFLKKNDFYVEKIVRDIQQLPRVIISKKIY